MIYTKLYPTVMQRVLHHLEVVGQIHGSLVRDFFIEYADGRFLVDNHAEALLTELVEEGKLKVLDKAPTPSQAAFAGLSTSSSSYRVSGWLPGHKEHFWYAKA